jgi:hypothetical protein
MPEDLAAPALSSTPPTPSSATSPYPIDNVADWGQVLRRQTIDNKLYGKFPDQGEDIKERTDAGRLNDSQRFIRDYLKQDPRKALIVDIGSGLGHKNPKLAGATVYDLMRDPSIAKQAHVVGTDIKDELGKNPLPGMDTAEIPMDFSLPLQKIAKGRGDQPVWILRAANSIDLLMNQQQTRKHFEDLIGETAGHDVVYLFNKHILYKGANDNRFKLIGDLANEGFAHQGQAWKQNLARTPYTLRTDTGTPHVQTTTSVDLPKDVRPAPFNVSGSVGSPSNTAMTDPASVRVTTPPPRALTRQELQAKYPQGMPTAPGVTDPMSVRVTNPVQPYGAAALNALTIVRRLPTPTDDLTILRRVN